MKKYYLFPVFFALCAAAQAQSQAFTSSGSFVVPAGVTSVNIEVVGAGGSGGGNGTGGGGGGGYAYGSYAVTPGQTLTVTVGTGGGGAIGGGTSVDMLIAASGGEDGVFPPSNTVGGGGAGGTGIGGTINRNGGNGGGGYYTYFGGGGGGAAGSTGNGMNGGDVIPWTGICLTPGGAAGMSGGAPGGNGGKGAGFTDVNCSAADPSTPGANYGGGGGGGNGNSYPGQEGAGGYCMITWTVGGGCTVDTSVTSNLTTITSNATNVTYQWINCADSSIIAGETSQSFTPSATGSYAVIVTDNICSDTSVCVSITVTEPCIVDTSLTVTSTSISSNLMNGNYQWVNCAGFIPVPGETDQLFVPTVSGDYAVILTVDSNCADTSACVTIIVTTGLEDHNASLVQVYPNPFTGMLNVQHAEGSETYALINATGRAIWTGTNIAGKDFTTLPAGLYLLRVQRGQQLQTLRLVKQ